jgi:hypothetical protein
MKRESLDCRVTVREFLTKPQAMILSFQIPENPYFGITLKEIQ